MILLKALQSFFFGTWRFLLVFFLLFVLGYAYIRHELIVPSTNDGVVQAHVLGVAARVSGIIKEVHIVENQWVKKGQLLFTLDPSLYQIALDAARAKLVEAQQNRNAANASIAADNAKLKFLAIAEELAKDKLLREQGLAKNQTISASQLEEAQRKWEEAVALVEQSKNLLKADLARLGSIEKGNAQILSAKAALAKAQLNLDYTKVYAPSRGYISHFNLQAGSPVKAFETLFGLVSDQLYWVSAHYLETELMNIKAGQPAEIRLLLYPSHVFKGKVLSVSYGMISQIDPSVPTLPYVKPTIDWLRLTRRFPVRVQFLNLDPKYPLRVGANARVRIDTR